MKKFLSFLSNNKFNITVLSVYCVLTVILLINHEIWRDEAQVWCLARDLSLVDMLKQARIEGHPFLWYLIVRLFAVSGLPVISMQILSFLFVFLSVVILLFKSPFSRLEKILVIFSAGFLYYFPVVARNYSLIPVCLFALAFFFNDKKEHPFLIPVFIVLLSNTHLYIIGLSVSLFVLYLIENYKKSRVKIAKILIPSLCVILNFILLFSGYVNTQNDNYALTAVNNNNGFFELIKLLSLIFVHPVINRLKFLIPYAPLIGFVLFVFPVGIFSFCLLKSSRKIFFVFFSGLSFILFVFLKIWLNGVLYQKAFIIYLFMIFCFWLYKNSGSDKNKILSNALYIPLIISITVALIVGYQEIKYNFSSGKQIAEYIKNHINDEKIFIALGNPFVYSSVSAYLPDKKIYSVLSESYISFYTYGNSQAGVKHEIFPENARYYIVSEDAGDARKYGLKPIFSSGKKVLSSRYLREVFQICVEN